MAVNQAKIFEQLEQLTQELDGDEFIYSFLTVFGFPKGTISRIRNGNDSRNLAKEAGHVALKNKLYFQPTAEKADLNALLDCSGQLNPDTWLGRTSAFAGGIPSYSHDGARL